MNGAEYTVRSRSTMNRLLDKFERSLNYGYSGEGDEKKDSERLNYTEARRVFQWAKEQGLITQKEPEPPKPVKKKATPETPGRCRLCKKAFRGNKGRLYCCVKCKNRWEHLHRKERDRSKPPSNVFVKCVCCGKPFVKQGRRINCSIECSKERDKEQWKRNNQRQKARSISKYEAI